MTSLLSTFSIMPDSVFFVGKAGPKTVTRAHPRYETIVDNLLARIDPTDLVDVAARINRTFVDGKVRVEDGTLLVDGRPVEDEGLGEYVVRLVEAGETDPTPFLRFVESLDRNPSRNSRSQLFAFVRANGLTLHADGRILAYKGVRDDYKDKHSGTFDNRPGSIHLMPRRDIDDNPDNHCSYGFHVAAWGYASSFGERTTLVAVAAEDVVSVPNDHDAQKMRVCKYEVISEVVDDTPVGVPVYRQEPEDDYDDEPKRFRVVLKALAPGLGGYEYKTFDMIAEENAEDAADVAHELWGRFDAELASVTEL